MVILRKVLTIIVVMCFYTSFSQDLVSLKKELVEIEIKLKELNREEMQAKSNISDRLNTGERASLFAEITTEYMVEKEKWQVRKNNIEQIIRRLEREENIARHQKNEERRIDNLRREAEYLQQTQRRQAQSYQQMVQSVNNTLDNVSRTLEGLHEAEIRNELNRRQLVASNFIDNNTSIINRLEYFYNNTPPENFEKIINGTFEAYIIFSESYSFVNNQELNTVQPALVEVNKNRITGLFPYGNKEMELNYPLELPNQSILDNGIVRYNDYKTFKTITVFVLEPYLSETPQRYKVEKGKAGSIILYTTRRKDAGKIVWIQEIDEKNNNVIREVRTELQYARNNKSIDHIEPIPVNPGNSIYYFGPPVKRPWGVLPLFLKVRKRDRVPLDVGESRVVRIQNYRE